MLDKTLTSKTFWVMVFVLASIAAAITGESRIANGALVLGFLGLMVCADMDGEDRKSWVIVFLAGMLLAFMSGQVT